MAGFSACLSRGTGASSPDDMLREHVVQQRPAIPLFGAAVADHDAEDMLTLCAMCARVAWPMRSSNLTNAHLL